MKHINKIVLLSVITGLTTGLICGPTSIIFVLAAQPDPCFLGDCTGKQCDNNPGKLTASCCWSKPGVVPPQTVCQTCEVNTETGEFENCTSVPSKGSPDSGSISPPPSGVAPPPSTENCPDDTAKDANGNCTPLTQSPEDSSSNDNDDNIPQFPRGNILGEIQTNNELQPQS